MRRKFKRRILKKPTISKEEYDVIGENAEAAQELLESERFLFFREYLENTKESISELILENRITEVHEEVSVSSKLKRLLITPKKIQVDELVGQYKFVKQILDDLVGVAKMKQEVEEAIQRKELIMQEDEE